MDTRHGQGTDPVCDDHVRPWTSRLSLMGAFLFGGWGISRWTSGLPVDMDNDLWAWGLVLSVIGLITPILLPVLVGRDE